MPIFRSPSDPQRRVPETFSDYAGDKQFATTLARGLTLLKCFTPMRPLLGNKDLAELTNLPKPTVSRLTYTLVQMGYLRMNREIQKYQLGAGILSLGYPLLSPMTWRQLVRPLTNELAEYAQGAVSLSVRERLQMVYVETSRSSATFAAQKSEVGFSLPLLASVTGRAYLAACEPRERERLLNEVMVKQPLIWEEYKAKLPPAIAMYHAKGFCVARGDLREDLFAVAAPLSRTWHGDLIVVTCAVHSSRLKGDQLENDLGPRLTRLSARIESILSHSGIQNVPG